jgi:hypothetical protein
MSLQEIEVSNEVRVITPELSQMTALYMGGNQSSRVLIQAILADQTHSEVRIHHNCKKASLNPYTDVKLPCDMQQRQKAALIGEAMDVEVN